MLFLIGFWTPVREAQLCGREFSILQERKIILESNKRIALIGIVVEDLASTEQLNRILHEYAEAVIGRMGLPCRERGVSIISVVVDAPTEVTSSLSGKLGKLPGVSVKTVTQKADRS